MSETQMSTGEAQAQRLEAMLAEIEAAVSRPGVSERLHAAPGPEEWNVLQVIAHVNEMIPYWLNHCQNLIAFEGDPPAFGRTLDSPERLEGVARADRSDLDGLMQELRGEIQSAVTMVRGLTDAQRAKQGVHNRLGLITVSASIDSFVLDHGENHVRQLQAALGE